MMGAAMPEIDRILNANEGYAAARSNLGSAKPGRRLAIVTCMDARIDVFAVMGLHLGDAHVIRNAGGRVTEDVLRSLALSVHLLGVETVIVMQHTKCGALGISDDELRRMTGADVEFFAFDDHGAALREDLDVLKATPYLGPVQTFAGMVYDVETGELEDVVRWERPVSA
jgi:carbonic anhydrase